MGVGAGLYMYVVVVQKFTFAISSPDEFLFILGERFFVICFFVHFECEIEHFQTLSTSKRRPRWSCCWCCRLLITRRPCCRRELPNDAGHLYRKLAPDHRATQWIETSLKLSANMRKLSKNHFTRLVHQWRIDACHMVSQDPGPKFTKFGE